MANARFQSNGVDVLIDALLAAGETVGDLRDRLWQVAWARTYQDVLVPIPAPETKIDGFAVLSRAQGSRAVLCVDDGERLVGILDAIPVVPLGSKVRLQPTFGPSAVWSLKLIAPLGCGLQIRFDEAERCESAWVDRLRHALVRVRENELAVRRRVENERRTLAFAAAPVPFRKELEDADRELRERILSGGYTEEEKRTLAKAKSPDQTKKLVETCNQRLVDAYRAEAAAFRALIPLRRADWDRRMAAYASFRSGVDHLNATDAASRAVTDASLRATQQLDAIETAVLNVRAVDLGRIEEDPRGCFAEMMQTIDLLFELLPKRLQRQSVPTTN